jgi:hypothetical protein
MLSSLGLVFVGLCLALPKIYLPVGGWVAVRGVQLLRKWFPFALCGAFRGSVMIGALRTSRGLIRNFSICSYLLFFHLDCGVAGPVSD